MGFLGILVPLCPCCCCFCSVSRGLAEVTGGEDICEAGEEAAADEGEDAEVDVASLDLTAGFLGFHIWPAPESTNQGGRGR